MNNINNMSNETIQKLSENQKIFLNSLSNYIDDEIYLYGSITRFDYIPEKSDLDIDIFTDNEHSTIQKLCVFLNLKKEQFEKIVYKINNVIITGYKKKYINEEKKLTIEISVYNQKNKQTIIKQHNKSNELPYIILVLLYIFKCLYYKFGVLNNIMYSYIKRFLMHMSFERNFILL